LCRGKKDFLAGWRISFFVADWSGNWGERGSRSKNEYGGRDYGGKTVVLDNGRLSDIAGPHDLAADLEDVLLFIPAFVHVEIDAERGSQHGGREIFRIIAGLFFRLSKGVVLAYITVGGLVRRDGATDGSGLEPLGFVAARPAHDAVGNGARDHGLEPLGPGDHFRPRGEDAGDQDEVTFFNAGITEGPFEGMKFVFMGADPFGKKDLGRDKGFHCQPPPLSRIDIDAVLISLRGWCQ